MANALQLRRGTTTQHNTFTGLAGEVTVDTDKETVVVHDGSTAGGFPLARASDLTNFDADTLDGKQLATIESEYQAFANTAAANVVDSAPGTLDTLNELAAALGDDPNFATTVTNSIATKMPLAGGTFTGNVSFGDSDKAIFGAGSDLEILHDGNSVIRTIASSAGDFYIQSQGTGHDLYLQADDDVYIRPQGGENGIKVIGDGAVELYHNNSMKAYTDSSGFSVSGRLKIDGSNVTNTFVGGTVFQGTGSGWNLRAHTTSSTGTAQVFGVLQHSETNTDSPGGNILSCLNNGNVGIGIDSPSERLHVNGTARIDGTLDIEEVFEKVSIGSSTSGTIGYDFLGQAVVFFSNNQTANRTINFVGDSGNTFNSILDIGQSATCAVLLAQGSTAYYLNAYQVDGSAVTPKWSGGSAPTEGNASGIDVYTFTIIKTANATFTVLASQSQYA